MNTLLMRAKNDPAYPFKVYNWCVFEILDCDCALEQQKLCKSAYRLDANGKRESFYEICLERAAGGDGFYSLSDVLNKFVLMDAAVFDAQWFCLKPGRSTLIFPEFDIDIHVTEFQIPFLSSDPKIRNQWKPVIVMDIGWTDPLCVLLAAEHIESRELLVFDELYGSQLHKHDVADWLRTRYKLYRLDELYTNFAPLVFTDARAPRDIAEFNLDHGIKCIPVTCGIMAGIQAFRPYLSAYQTLAHPTVKFHKENVSATPAELQVYSWKIHSGTGLPTGETPAANQLDHGADGIRYLMMVLGKIPGIQRAIIVRDAAFVRPTSSSPTSSRWKQSSPLRPRNTPVPTSNRWAKRSPR